MDITGFITLPENFNKEWRTFLAFQHTHVKVHEIIYKKHQNRLLKRELCSDTFSREAETIQTMTYNFFQENLGWIIKYMYIGQGPIRLMLKSARDVSDDFGQWTLMDYALLIGDAKSASLFVKYGISEQTFCRNPKRKSMDLFDRQTGKLTLGPSDPVNDIGDPHFPEAEHLNLDNSTEFLRLKLALFSFEVHAIRSNLFPPIDPVEYEFYDNYARYTLLNKFDDHGKLDRNARGFRRILLIAKLLQAWTNSAHIFEDRKLCLKLYFQTIKDPFICREEFQEFISFFYGNVSKDSIKILTGDYESLFQDFAPRSLMHLCRCTLRSSLAKKDLYLPDAVSSLRCPNRLKSYIYGNYEFVL